MKEEAIDHKEEKYNIHTHKFLKVAQGHLGMIANWLVLILTSLSYLFLITTRVTTILLLWMLPYKKHCIRAPTLI